MSNELHQLCRFLRLVEHFLETDTVTGRVGTHSVWKLQDFSCLFAEAIGKECTAFPTHLHIRLYYSAGRLD